MTQPREVVPGATHFLTRRTLRRHYLLHPDSAMRQLVVYALGVCSTRHGILVHGFCTLSNHIHMVVTDVHGVLPRFLADFHRAMALATKVLRKWEGATWDHEQTSAVRLLTAEAIVDKLAYVIANPVEAGLVRYSADWPGAKSRVSELGVGAQRAKRPNAWFRPESWPDEAELRLVPPPGVAAEDVDAWRASVAGAVREHEGHARAAVEERGRAFVGVERLRDVSPYERATSYEPLRSRNPTFATGGVGDAYRRAVKSLRAFRDAYRIALGRWREGVRDIVFPPGTWWMARVHSVVVQA